VNPPSLHRRTLIAGGLIEIDVIKHGVNLFSVQIASVERQGKH